MCTGSTILCSYFSIFNMWLHMTWLTFVVCYWQYTLTRHSCKMQCMILTGGILVRSSGLKLRKSFYSWATRVVHFLFVTVKVAEMISRSPVSCVKVLAVLRVHDVCFKPGHSTLKYWNCCCCLWCHENNDNDLYYVKITIIIVIGCIAFTLGAKEGFFGLILSDLNWHGWNSEYRWGMTVSYPKNFEGNPRGSSKWHQNMVFFVCVLRMHHSFVATDPVQVSTFLNQKWLDVP